MCCYGNYWNVKELKEEKMILEEIAIEEVVIEVEKSN